MKQEELEKRIKDLELIAKMTIVIGGIIMLSLFILTMLVLKLFLYTGI